MKIIFNLFLLFKITQLPTSMDQKSLIDFCIVSSDLFSDVLDVRVKRGAEMSTDHHLVVSKRFDVLRGQLLGNHNDFHWQLGG